MVADGNKTPGAAGGGGGGYAAERDFTEPAEPPRDPAPSAAFAEITDRLSEVREYIAYYVKTRIDSVRLTIRNLMLLCAVVLVAIMTAAAMVLTAIVFLCMGIAEGFTALFGGRTWAGNFLTAFLMLGIIAGGAYYVVIRITKTSRANILKSYADRKHRQRQEHGIDVEQRAEQQRADKR